MSDEDSKLAERIAELQGFRVAMREAIGDMKLQHRAMVALTEALTQLNLRWNRRLERLEAKVFGGS